MITLVIGGASSGKSGYAEDLVLARGENRVYVATMEPFGEEGARRIRRHREMRAGKGFATLERTTDLAGAAARLTGCNVLLEDLPNLVANEVFSISDRSDDEVIAAACEGIMAAAEHAAHLTVVTGDLTSDGVIYDASTERYLRLLGIINAKVAAFADEVIEIACGQVACRLKG